MLKTDARIVSLDRFSNSAPSPSIASAVAFMRRNWMRILISVVIMLALAILYLLTEPSTYTAQGVVSADVRRAAQFQLSPGVEEGAADTTYIQSQVEVLRSDNVLLAVVRKLRLADDQEFLSQNKSIVDSIVGFLKKLPAMFKPDDSGPPTQEQLEFGAVAVLRDTLLVERIPLTNVLTIAFSSRRADLTAAVVNAIIESYIQDQMSFRLASSALASDWLQDRVHELREQARKAAQDVQTYKEEKGIVDTGRGLVSTQQIEQLTTQIVTAVVQAADAKARLDRVREILKKDATDATLENASTNEGIMRLRAEYLEAKKVEASLAGRPGADQTLAALRARMSNIQSAINDEFKRVAESLESEYEIAVRREKELRSGLAQVVQDAATMSKAMVPAQELESTAQTYQALYEAFLRRSAELIQQQSFPGSAARVLSPAVVPTSPSGPKAPVIILGALAFGTFAGVGLGLAREKLKNSLRTQHDVDALLGLQVIGVLPRIRIRRLKDLWSFMRNSPRSRFVEQLSATAVSLLSPQEAGQHKTIGITSAVPQEGKTAFAAALAMSLGTNGHKVLLIEADFRGPNPDYARLGNDAATLVDILSGRNRPGSITGVAGGAFDMIPAGSLDQHTNPCAALASSQMHNLISKCREIYDFTILDLPAQLPVADARAVAHFIDEYIMIIEWDKTNRNAVLRAVELVQEVGGTIRKCVFSKVDERAYYREEGLLGASRYNRMFKRLGAKLAS